MSKGKEDKPPKSKEEKTPKSKEEKVPKSKEKKKEFEHLLDGFKPPKIKDWANPEVSFTFGIEKNFKVRLHSELKNRKLYY